MKKTSVVHICVAFALLLMTACAAATTESRTEESKPQECLDIKDCPAGFRCDFKSHTCIRAY